MAVAAQDVLGLLSKIGITVEGHEGGLRYRPASAMTPDLLATVKSCKGELIRLLRESAVAAPTAALLPRGPGAGAGPDVATSTSTRTAPAQSIAQSTQLGDDPKVDAEFDRFEQVAEPFPGGSGWFDPTQEPVPVGVPIGDWRAFERDCGNLGKRSNW